MTMSLDRLQPYFGFTRLPFGREVTPAALYRSGDEAVGIVHEVRTRTEGDDQLWRAVLRDAQPR
jgi:hypothetical protein